MGLVGFGILLYRRGHELPRLSGRMVIILFALLILLAVALFYLGATIGGVATLCLATLLSISYRLPATRR